MHSLISLAWSAVLLAGPATLAQAQQHVRGDVVSIAGNALEVRSRGGEVLKLELPQNAGVSLVGKGDIGGIQDGAFIGTTAVPQPDGTLRAVEVHLFAESLRGRGEGHRPWDLQPGSTMTNATVAKVDDGGGKVKSGGTGSTMTNATVAKVDESGAERRLSLQYKGGEKTVIVPSGTPVVTIEPADRSQLVPGAHLFAVVSRKSDGTLVAERLNVGKDGLVPPM